MKKKKLFIAILAGIMALILLMSLAVGIIPQPANAASDLSELEKELQELKEEKKKIDKQIAGLESQLSSNMTAMEQIVAQKNTIDQEIFMLHEQVNNINDQIAAYGTLIADKQAELEEAEALVEELNKKNKERIRAMEEGGDLSYWSVVFEANSFVDLLDRLDMINEIAEADQRRLKEMGEAAQVVADAKESLEKEKTALEATKKELSDSQAVLETKRQEADKLLAELVATGEEYQKLLDEAEEEASGLKGEINSTQNQYDAAKREQWLSTSVPPSTSSKPSGGSGGSNVVGGITWLLPCNYTRFSSPFGWRIHPIYKDWRFHYGVDLSGPSGTPIVATRSGVVKYTLYDSSSGYWVQIDHKDGFESKYLHLTHYIVKPGQQVTAGQVIGYMGSTGASTGPHLHLSILYKGSHVNPADYINI